MDKKLEKKSSSKAVQEKEEKVLGNLEGLVDRSRQIISCMAFLLTFYCNSP